MLENDRLSNFSSPNRRSLANISNLAFIHGNNVNENASEISLENDVSVEKLTEENTKSISILQAKSKEETELLPDMKVENVIETLRGKMEEFVLPTAMWESFFGKEQREVAKAKKENRIWLSESHIDGESKEKTKMKKENAIWLSESPIFVVDARKKATVHSELFPKRQRWKFCYLCGSQNAELLKCAIAGCPSRLHALCAQKSTIGGYTYAFMKRKTDHSGLICSRHHCTACFADHNRSRCFCGSMVCCNQCELAWHRDCVPGGCTIDIKNEITCPRHVAFPDHPTLHLQHCAYCQQKPRVEENLVKCTKCFRSAHFKCYRESKMGPILDVEEEWRHAICHWCDMFDFVRQGDFAMGRFSRQWWYPCQIVATHEYPEKNNPQFGSIGYVCVKWLPYKGKVLYNLLTHNRIIAMTDHNYFFVNEARRSDIYDEWSKAQKYMVKNGPLYRPLKQDQIPEQGMSNGEKMIKKIQAR